MARALTKAECRLLNNPRYLALRLSMEIACRYSRLHVEALRLAYDVYGEKGPHISAIGQSHFPDDTKAKLRDYATRCSMAVDFAYVKRGRVRHDTVRAIGRLVAARDGSGFYGPQP